MASRINGRTNAEYAKTYYQRNREWIAVKSKERYQNMRMSPEGLLVHRVRSTEATRRWRARHPDRVRESRRLVYLNRKRRALEILGGARCVNCGCDVIDFLEINHINGGGSKEHRMNGRVGTADRLLSGKRKSDGLNVMCRVCNAMDYLKAKNPIEVRRFVIIWEKFTGKKAEKSV